MARRSHRFTTNTPGEFYVDRTCIDCGRCQREAPGHFEREATGGHSFVALQPQGGAEREACERAVAACPVGAIGADGLVAGPPPLRQLLPDLYACGHPSALADDANAYLIVRPGGNVLVDVPAFDPDLVARLEDLGDLRYIFLTHVDTVGEVEDYQLHFGAEVIMHASEAGAVGLGVARPFEGSGPLFPDLQIIHTPGHTRGSSCLLWRRHGGCLFVGDHLLPDGAGLAPQPFDWTEDWALQLATARGLLSEPWHHAFPAHGAEELPRGFVPKAKAHLAAFFEASEALGA